MFVFELHAATWRIRLSTNPVPGFAGTAARDLQAMRNRPHECFPSRLGRNLPRMVGNPAGCILDAIHLKRVRQCVRSSSCPQISTASRIDGAEPKNLSATLANLSAASVT